MEVITKNRDILGGTPVFRGTRVPIQTLFDYLEGGEALEDFLAGFPTVSRESSVAVLEEATRTGNTTNTIKAIAEMHA
jgi:uncharacterized protein (DUF433 family)